MKSFWIPLLLLSFSAVGAVSFEEKENRIEYLESLQQQVPAMDIDVYKREIQYEKMGLSIDERAKAEASHLAEKIKTQILRAYEASLEMNSPEEAAREVREAIIKDSKLINLDMRNEIRELSLKALAEIQDGRILNNENLESIEKSLLRGIKERYEFLNQEASPIPMSAKTINSGVSGENIEKDQERKEYASRKELVESLASEKENIKWVSAGGSTLKSQAITKKEISISLQVKAEFLGVSISAGPSFTFTREYSSDVQITSEGMNPVLLSDGNFDFYKRDHDGNIVIKNGKHQKRFMSFHCNTTLEFASESNTGGGFTLEGIGASGSLASKYTNSVNMSSRRVAVPEYVDGKSTTFVLLTQICMNDFLRARVTNNMTISQSLNIMMKNVVASLIYSHPKTKCVKDSQCLDWFENDILSIAKIGNRPRCVEESREKFYQCQIRGLKGQNCAVYNAKGKLISDGMFEFPCDNGLQCVKVQNEGWFTNWEVYQFAKGKCMPINAKNYQTP
jgi:hypothetical protein